MEKTNKQKSKAPYNITIYKNLAYNIYSRNFLKWAIRDSEKAKALLEWSKDTLTPDEHYWRSLESIDEAPDRGKWKDYWQISRIILWRASGRHCSGKYKTAC